LCSADMSSNSTTFVYSPSAATSFPAQQRPGSWLQLCLRCFCFSFFGSDAQSSDGGLLPEQRTIDSERSSDTQHLRGPSHQTDSVYSVNTNYIGNDYSTSSATREEEATRWHGDDTPPWNTCDPYDGAKPRKAVRDYERDFAGRDEEISRLSGSKEEEPGGTSRS